jgi:hypothetical protein
MQRVLSEVKPDIVIASANVRYWHKADIPACADLCPLSGVKQTLAFEQEKRLLYSRYEKTCVFLKEQLIMSVGG